MSDINESSLADTSRARWLLLLADLPIQPAYLRVKLHRRLQRIGAIGLKGGVFALPAGPERLGAFRLLREEIRADGGQAALWSARLIEGMTDADLIALFGADRDAEYRRFATDCAELGAEWAAAKNEGDRSRLLQLAARRDRLFSRLEGVLVRDYFLAGGREAAMQAMEDMALLEVPPARHGSRAAGTPP